jgi:hypothetical protein
MSGLYFAVVSAIKNSLTGHFPQRQREFIECVDFPFDRAILVMYWPFAHGLAMPGEVFLSHCPTVAIKFRLYAL